MATNPGGTDFGNIGACSSSRDESWRYVLSSVQGDWGSPDGDCGSPRAISACSPQASFLSDTSYSDFEEENPRFFSSLLGPVRWLGKLIGTPIVFCGLALKQVPKDDLQQTIESLFSLMAAEAAYVLSPSQSNADALLEVMQSQGEESEFEDSALEGLHKRKSMFDQRGSALSNRAVLFLRIAGNLAIEVVAITAFLFVAGTYYLGFIFENLGARIWGLDVLKINGKELPIPRSSKKGSSEDFLITRLALQGLRPFGWFVRVVGATLQGLGCALGDVDCNKRKLAVQELWEAFCVTWSSDREESDALQEDDEGSLFALSEKKFSRPVGAMARLSVSVEILFREVIALVAFAAVSILEFSGSIIKETFGKRIESLGLKPYNRLYPARSFVHLHRRW